MSFRDDRLALLERAEQSERSLDLTKLELERVRAERDRAIARVRDAGLDPFFLRPGPVGLHRALDRASALVVFGLGATAAAGYRSESYGIQWALIASVALGFWIGTAVTRRAHPGVRLGAGIIASGFALLFAVLFFSLFWRGL